MARALVLAAEAKRWDVAAQIAEELRRSGKRSDELRAVGAAQSLVEGVKGECARAPC